MGPIIPYCGIAPVPGTAVWNLDPVLIACLALLAGADLWRVRGLASWRVGAVALGWAVLAAALVSPLCNLSVALFAARASQHMLVAVVAAPLIALGWPSPGRAAPLAPATAVFAAALWAWHTPALYDATFTSTALYWMMHVTVGASAVWLWAALFARKAQPFSALAASFVTGLQMSLLGALFTFGTRAWFSVHELTTAAWGLTPVEDQQLGGLLMWIPAGALVTAYGVAVLWRELASLSQASARRLAP